MRNLKEYVKKGLDNIIEITKETSSEYDKKIPRGEFFTCFWIVMRERTFLMDKTQSS